MSDSLGVSLLIKGSQSLAILQR